ncbi:MAG: PHP domain-containing protein [Bacteroidales bacterium]|nr:PHP domain-containing protein [Bacteroidales bacterium]MCI2121395.1 PHP domain-containing protein [Bacteroidales bacterium]MCI2145486.1 PHP domain-containing protein [Bacteroidales bacterium]
MRTFKGDLHNHTLLSPCGDIEMTPAFMVRKAVEEHYDFFAVTDHNSTLQCAQILPIAKREGITVFCGAELNTREEVHCIALVEEGKPLDELQEFLDLHLPHIGNDVDKFGYQLVVNEKEEILFEAPYLLINALDVGINECERFVHSIGGIFYPAHVDRTGYSIISQLGFIPSDLDIECIEFSKNCRWRQFMENNRYLKRYNPIRSSDAHYPEDFATVSCRFTMERPTLKELGMALRGEGGRKVEIV